MKKKLVWTLGAAALALVSNASATSFYGDLSSEIIFGSGNSNGNFAVTQENGVELGLRAKIPFTGLVNSDGVSTYSFNTAEILAGPDDAWNFEWSINSDLNGTGRNLNDLVYLFQIDYDPGLGTNFVAGDLVNLPPGFWLDHSIGDDTTANGGGAEATDAASYNALIDGNNILQQSWRNNWVPFAPAFDPFAVGTYEYILTAFESDGTTVLASTSITVEINGGAPVPEPATMTLLGLGLAGLGMRYRKRNRG
jgi:hypothetical protein